jgi:hypothetical protein
MDCSTKVLILWTSRLAVNYAKLSSAKLLKQEQVRPLSKGQLLVFLADV